IFRQLQRSLHLPASVLLHTANSAATLFHPESHYDLVRPGLILYGVSPNPKRSLPFPLRPALSLKARITQLKTVPPGVPIGYSGTFVSSRLTTVALLPVGYADGLPRCLSNRQDVLVRGKRCPLIGNVSMDQCAIDVTDVPVEVGEAVTLLGEGIMVEEWSETAKTIPYEIICGLGMRLPKVFDATRLSD
ncbi:MAG TPA: alanine racemase, partial [Chroococcales cyanobacterium]